VFGQEILTRSGSPKGKKNKTQKWPLCHFFDTQKAVLGEWRFGGANELQIQKFQLGWKVDRTGFPKSPLGYILGTCKCPKTGPNVA